MNWSIKVSPLQCSTCFPNTTDNQESSSSLRSTVRPALTVSFPATVPIVCISRGIQRHNPCFFPPHTTSTTTFLLTIFLRKKVFATTTVGGGKKKKRGEKRPEVERRLQYSSFKCVSPNSTAFTAVLSENPTWKKHKKQTWMSLKRHTVNLIGFLLAFVMELFHSPLSILRYTMTWKWL